MKNFLLSKINVLYDKTFVGKILFQFFSHLEEFCIIRFFSAHMIRPNCRQWMLFMILYV